MIKPISTRLEEYIEFAEKTKRYADAGFYKEVLAELKRLQPDPEVSPHYRPIRRSND